MIRYITLCLALPALQAQTLTGTVNGTSIPSTALNPTTQQLEVRFVAAHVRTPATADDQQEINTTILHKWQCTHLNSLIHHAAISTLKQQINVPPATDAEVADVRAQQAELQVPPQQAQAVHSAILTGLSQVYDKGQDPTAVYQQLNLSQYGLRLDHWQMMVLTQRDPAQRQHMQKVYQAMDANPNPPASALKTVIEQIHFADAVDQLIASRDPTFQQYLSEADRVRTQQGAQVHIGPMNAAHFKYLKQARYTFWQQQEAKVNVSLSDPTLGKSCGLPQFQ